MRCLDLTRWATSGTHPASRAASFQASRGPERSATIVRARDLTWFSGDAMSLVATSKVPFSTIDSLRPSTLHSDSRIPPRHILTVLAHSDPAMAPPAQHRSSTPKRQATRPSSTMVGRWRRARERVWRVMERYCRTRSSLESRAMMDRAGRMPEAAAESRLLWSEITFETTVSALTCTALGALVVSLLSAICTTPALPSICLFVSANEREDRASQAQYHSCSCSLPSISTRGGRAPASRAETWALWSLHSLATASAAHRRALEEA
mmetsp:Transcript_11791/g.28617  ORF Transcript_11791/g.28617 Transcript_11791/m.28617 type:complete len:265 (+) Transcript_11791:714-1508(+)